MQLNKIDLICFNVKNKEDLKWDKGDILPVDKWDANAISSINKLITKTESDWVLFRDYNLGIPDDELINELTEKKADAWHAGLKLGLNQLPEKLNYINPVWIYNKDVPQLICGSSFRLSLRAAIVKTSVLRKAGGIPIGYQTMAMAGLAMGYSILKHGGVIRYCPKLAKMSESQLILPLVDEWTFVRHFFASKWQVWILLNSNNILSDFLCWIRTMKTKRLRISHDIHSSEIINKISQTATISVLAPTLDRYSYLENELSQLEQQTILPKEVLITDQTDVDRRQKIDAAKYNVFDIRYFPQDEKGQCLAWNKLLEEAKGEYVLFLGDDADSIPTCFIEKLYTTAIRFDADIVASNVVEIGTPNMPVNHYYYMSDTFPITLAKKATILKAGGMDMFFNRNIRADYDLALRCHEEGALMIFDSSAIIGHHRAPVGGLRAHKARVTTHRQAKSSVAKFTEPTSSEIFLVKKHFNKLQYRNYIRIKYFDQLVINGNLFKQFLRLIFFLCNIPSFVRNYHKHKSLADQELKKRNLLKY